MDNIAFQTVKNKKKILYIALAAVVVILGVIFIIKFAKTRSNASDDLLANQYVDGLSFENANMKVKNGETIFTAEVYNESDADYELKNIYVMITTPEKEYKLVSYVGNSIKKDDGKYIETKVDAELDDATKIQYVINKD